MANKRFEPSDTIRMIKRWLHSHHVDFDLKIKEYLPVDDNPPRA